MSDYKRLRKKNTTLTDVDRSGITRMGKTWTIRLRWHKGKPAFQHKVYDADFGGDSVKSFIKAVEIANENRPKYPGIKFVPKSNYVKGLYISKHANTSKKSFYWTWKLTYPGVGKNRCKTFGFWMTGAIFEKYLEAVGFALLQGIQIEHDKVRDYFFDYITEVPDERFREFLTRSDMHLAYSETDLAILKLRYLTPKQKQKGKAVVV